MVFYRLFEKRHLHGSLEVFVRVKLIGIIIFFKVVSKSLCADIDVLQIFLIIADIGQ